MVAGACREGDADIIHDPLHGEAMRHAWPVLVSLAACGGWKPLTPAQVPSAHRGAQLFVITSDRAFEIQLDHVDDAAIHGAVYHAWKITGDAHRVDEPDDIDGWPAAKLSRGTPIAIDRAAVQRVSLHHDANPALVVGGMLGAVVGVVVFGFVLAVNEWAHADVPR
jgi:hypothetical protein